MLMVCWQVHIPYKGVFEILKQGHFELYKFYSNNREAWKHVAENDSSIKILDFGVNEKGKNIRSNVVSCNGHLKRTIFSSVSQAFDPLDVLSPCIIRAKILMHTCGWKGCPGMKDYHHMRPRARTSYVKWFTNKALRTLCRSKINWIARICRRFRKGVWRMYLSKSCRSAQ